MTNEFNPLNIIWTEKYRPNKVSDMVGDFKDKIMKYLVNVNSIPHFLLYSKTPGTGKTTLAKAIINEIGCDALIINSSDDRKIDVIREKVKEFSITQSSKHGLRKCVFLDEMDGMLKPSQNALRNVMETFAKNVFFIITCNNINKIIEPLQSRCTKIPFAYPNRDEIRTYLSTICISENMEYTNEALDILIKLNYPSIRNCVSVLQDLFTQGLPVTKDTVKPANELFEFLWNKYIERDWKEIKKTVMATTVDPRELNTYFWERAINQTTINTRLIQILARNEKDIAWGADSKVIFVTSLIEMLK